MEFDDRVKGGESSFLDAFAAADYFRTHYPDKFEVCSRGTALVLYLFVVVVVECSA